jgi:predicted nucleic acid-binding protein
MLLLDNTVLSNFALIARVDLLIEAMGDQISTPPQVIDEFNEGVARGRLPQVGLDWLEVVSLEADEEALYQELTGRLNAGEAACLAVAAHRGGRVLTDDRDARILAAQIKIPISGTLGSLLRLIRMQALTLSEANELLSQMIAHGYRSLVEKLEDL